MGKGGVLHAELASSLYGSRQAPMLLSFIGGLGGRDLPPEEFYEMVAVANAALEKGAAPAPRLLYTAEELREVRKLQAVAAAERRQTGLGK
jgi:pyruvate ferredoxin oxidoreductase alpha subunit